ncbi:MAG: poly-gamma-glutamate system protein [Wenzhouxiangellaceae bacterium]|nr:poly-gamma-glutamate system protein [Wenzhouxiangellaceae bacterium]
MIGPGRGKRQQMYWRPTKIPGRALLLLAVAAIVALVVVENFKASEAAEYYDDMLSASRIVQEAIDVLRPIRGRIEPINPQVDLTRSGLIGVASSPFTSNAGDLEAKQATINPNWGAVVVRMLAEAGVKRGETVAVAISGSFPALNIAVYAAMEVMDVEPIIIVSGSASQWGANVPGFGWMDIARHLREARIVDIKADAATLGGIDDRGAGLNQRGIEMIRQAAEQAGIEVFLPDSYEAAVADRIRIYREAAGGTPIAAYINVGGGIASTGPSSIDHFFEYGLSRTAPPRAFRAPSVMGHFLRQDVPVLNFSGMLTLTTRYGLPYPPLEPVSIGSGGVYQAVSYRRWLAGLMIVLLVVLTGVIMRSANIALAVGGSSHTEDTLKPKV